MRLKIHKGLILDSKLKPPFESSCFMKSQNSNYWLTDEGGGGVLCRAAAGAGVTGVGGR